MADGWEDVPSNDGWQTMSTDGWEDDPSNPAPVKASKPTFDDVLANINGQSKGPKPVKSEEVGLGTALSEGLQQAAGQRIGFDREGDQELNDMAGDFDRDPEQGVGGPGLTDAIVSALEGLWAPVSAGAAGAGYGIERAMGGTPTEGVRAGASLAELTNIGGLLFGGPGGAEAAAVRAKALQEAFDAGASVDDLIRAAPDLNPEQVAQAVAFRDKGGRGASFIPDEASMERALQNEANTSVLRRNIDRAEQPVSKLEEEAAAFKPRREPTAEDVFPSEEKLLADETALQERLQAEADAFLNRDADTAMADKADWEEAVKAEVDPEYAKALDEHTTAIDSHVSNIAKNWKNSPSIKVNRTIDDLPDSIREKVRQEGDGAKGVIDDKGNVHIIAENIEFPEDASAVLFHEALGHHGLAERFGDQLDGLFDRFYDTNKNFRDEVDGWLSSNPSAYDGVSAATRRRLAAEELLAERSELGKLDAKMWDIVKNNVKAFGRRLGLKLKYSDREIDTILAMAHDAVVNGRKTPAANGFRLSRGDGRRFRPKVSMTQESMSTANPVDDLSNFLRDKTEPSRYGTVSDPELQRMADDLGLTASKYVKARSLKEGNVAAKIKAAHQILTNQMDELAGLGEKARREGMTPSLFADIQERLRTVEAVYAKFDEDTSELGRALRALRQVSESRKSAQAAVRFMKDSEGSGGALTNPENVMELLDHLNRKSNELSPGEQAQLVRDASKLTLKDRVASFLSIPRSIKSSVDLSAPLRQGAMLMHKKEWWKAWGPMLRSAVSKKAYEEIMSEIRSRPTYPMMRKSGLSVTEIGGPLSNREEDFMSNVTKHIPLVAGSERAYSAFLNRLRADTFDSLVSMSEAAGIQLMEKLPPYNSGAARPPRPSKQLRDISRFINTATGRGEFKGMQGAGPMINSLFFSPRFLKSRFDLLNPFYYGSLSPTVRKEALKSLLAFGGISATVIGLFALNGAEVETDPRSSDFAKIKLGNIRYDTGAGLNQLATLYSRLATNETKSLKGNVRELGEGYGGKDAGEVIYKFLRNKFSPNANFLLELREGKNAAGEKVTPAQAAKNLVVPMFSDDYFNLVGEKGLAEGTLFAAPAAFGWGVQNFDIDKPRETEK